MVTIRIFKFNNKNVPERGDDTLGERSDLLITMLAYTFSGVNLAVECNTGTQN